MTVYRPLVQDGKTGASYYFDRSGDVVGISGSGLAINGNQPLTVLQQFMPKVSDGANQILFMSYQGSANEGFSVYLNSGKLFGCQNLANAYVNNVTSQAAVSLNSWHTCAYVSTGAAGFIYLDGMLTPTTTAGGALTGTTYKAAIGSAQDGTSAPFMGQVARTMVFNYALSEDKIKRYSAGAKLDFDDIGGSMTELFGNGALTSGTGWTINGNVALSSNTAVASGSSASFSSLQQTLTTGLVLGKRYRISFDVTAKTNATAAIVRVAGSTLSGNAIVATGTFSSVVAAGSRQSIDFIADGAGARTIAGIELQGMIAGDSITMDNFSIIQLGCVLDLEPESATPTVWHDESGNRLDGLVTGATLIDVPHFANTDYGPAAVVQQLTDNSVGASYRFNSASINFGTIANTANLLDYSYVITARPLSLSASWHTAMTFAGLGGTPYFARNGGIIGGYPNAMVNVPDLVSPHTYAVTSDLVAQSLYVDGILSKVGAPSQTAFSGQRFDLGATSGTAEFWDGDIFRTVLFNYVLSEDKIRRYSAGAKLDYEDIGGSLAQLAVNGTLEGTYVSGVAPSWVKTGAGSDVFADETSIQHSGTHCQKITWVNGGDSGIQQTITFPAIGKLIRMSAWVRSNRAGVVFKLQPNTPVNNASYTIQSANTWEKAEFIIPCPNAGTNTFMVYVDSGQQAGDIYYIDDVSFMQVGAVLDLEPENITTSQWRDSSGNNLHGTVSGALAVNKSAGYDEGTWTPTVTIGGGGTLSGWTQQYGQYTRVGRAVCCSCQITLGTVGGTPATIDLTMPLAGATGYIGAGSGRIGTTGEGLSVTVDNVSISCRKSDGANPATTGNSYRVSATYFV